MRTVPTMSLAAIAASVMLGLNTAPASAQTDPGRFVPAPMGTVTTYHRVSSGSYGTYDGPVRWVLGQKDWNGRMLTSVSSDGFGTQLMDPKTHGLVAQLNASGAPAYSFNPEVRYDWPLAVGKTWSSVHEMTQYQPPRVVPATFNVKVDAYEDVTVPAGTFKAFKLITTNSFGEVEQLWTVPSIGLSTVKVIRDRPSSHPLGAGHQEGVLTSRVVPAP